jgi:hypothetical protein
VNYEDIYALQFLFGNMCFDFSNQKKKWIEIKSESSIKSREIFLYHRILFTKLRLKNGK